MLLVKVTDFRVSLRMNGSTTGYLELNLYVKFGLVCRHTCIIAMPHDLVILLMYKCYKKLSQNVLHGEIFRLK